MVGLSQPCYLLFVRKSFWPSEIFLARNGCFSSFAFSMFLALALPCFWSMAESHGKGKMNVISKIVTIYNGISSLSMMGNIELLSI